MIGIFDSGLGGIQTLRYIQKLLPDYDYIFLADNAHVPYGEKTPTQIKSYTFECLEWLFEQGCQIVIIACNTAAAYSIRDRQSTNPHHKALSVTIPGIEAIMQSHTDHVTILATQATINAKIYEELLEKEGFEGSITNIPANDLVKLIENPHTPQDDISAALTQHFHGHNTDHTLVLGCTHFPIITPLITPLWSGPIVDPGHNAAIQLVNYIKRHPNKGASLTTGGTTTYYTTGDVDSFNHKVLSTFNLSIQSKKRPHK